MAEYSPLPWRVADIEHDYDILDADGKVAAMAAHGNRELAAHIVKAVNELDRLRDLVRRLCDELESHYYEPESMNDPSIIREAREAIGDGMKDGAR